MKNFQIVKNIFIFQFCLWAFLFLNYQIAYSNGNKVFLWEIKSKQNSVYLLGSVHAMPDTIYPLPALIEETYQRCDTIVFETKKEEKAYQKLIRKSFLKKGAAPCGKSIKSYLSDKTFGSLLEYLSESDLKLSQFNNLKPWMCSAYLFIIQSEKNGYKYQWGIDNYFKSKAESDKKNIKGLETEEQSFNSYLYHDKVDQDLFMQLSLKELNETEWFKMAQPWRDGNINFFLAMYDKSLLKKFPELDKRLVPDRNKLWVPQIIELTKYPGNSLVVVGLLHLIGEDSVIDLLSKRGVEITRK